MKLNDTIAAVSTPRGKGGIAVLRVSGDEAVAVADRVFAAKNKKSLAETESSRAVYGDIYACDAHGTRTRIDDGIAVVFRAPHSFTGEDTVEVSCHGGLLVTEEVLAALLAAGARPAEAGEFTRRAFLAGKLSLSEAESLGALLEAKTHAALVLSRAGLDGRLSAAAGDIYHALLTIASALYAAIDYPEEDLTEMSREEAGERVLAALARVRALADTYRSGHAVAEGIRTVICGRPNVGKSSLFNRLVGRDAAIVTDVAGTTRDILTETASVGAVTLRLLDTAGLRASEDAVERIGVARAKEALAEAELVLAVFDGSAPLTDEDKELLDALAAKGGVKMAVLNKNDEKTVLDAKNFADFSAVVSLSAKENVGLDALRDAIEGAFLDGSLSLSEDAVVANARQYASLVACAEALASTATALSDGLLMDICCSELERAMAALGGLDGREVSEDIVGEIFSKFCVGK
ncbi:MAG: tRNA uridine-5-carboxymethylaminomethyl(34) synthesis GTPase MnmE [Ruminococcaceae bacterium]|nr:tRNA uridine-5-carboxymethylaminomethyl(34) synthesis GTPase MnmE [Oscillospiraceae bacterium]